MNRRLQLGVEYNPGTDEAGPLGNLHLLHERARRPAVILGTSSGRIGTPSGRAYYVTASKDLSDLARVPLAPYLGLSYETYDDGAKVIGGLNVSVGRRWSALLIHDGVHLHPTATVEFHDRFSLTFVMVRGRDPGVSAAVSF